MPTSLARSSSSDGRVASALIPIGTKNVRAHRAADDGELLVAVRVGDRHLRRRNRVGRIGDGGRPLEQAFQAFVLRAFQSALCQPILSDFVAGPCTPHLAPKIAHFGHRESRSAW